MITTRQPFADTPTVTRAIEAATREIQTTLPKDVQITTTFRQEDFIENVIDALRDGAIIVTVKAKTVPQGKWSLYFKVLHLDNSWIDTLNLLDSFRAMPHPSHGRIREFALTHQGVEDYFTIGRTQPSRKNIKYVSRHIDGA